LTKFIVTRSVFRKKGPGGSEEFDRFERKNRKARRCIIADSTRGIEAHQCHRDEPFS